MDCERLINIVTTLFGGSEMGTVLTDGELKCIWANEAALRQFPTFAVPDGLLDLLEDGARAEYIANIARAASFSANVSYSLISPVHLQFLPVKTEDGNCGCIVLFHNPSGDGKADRFGSAEAAVAAYTNEYRMPLTIIFSTLGLMARKLDSEDESMRGYLRLITQNCYRLLRLSNNFSDISRFRAGISPVHPKNGDICSFLTGLCNAVSILTGSIGIPLECEIPEESIVLSFDPNRIAVAFLNLISNSCKYTREGNGIKVRLERKDKRVVITVTDRGQGVKPNLIDSIFTPYFTYDPGGKPFGGAGIGLSLVKYIIAQHEGTVAVQSEEGKGTTVAFTLPVRSDDDLPDYTAENSADYLADRFSTLYVELSDVCRCPLP